MKDNDAPHMTDAYRCLELRCKSKRGQSLTGKEQKLCERMRRDFPDWYSDTEREVFERTKPFGSSEN